MTSSEWISLLISAVGLLASLAGVALAIWFWKSSLERKIDSLIANRTALTFQQAFGLLDAYLSWTRAELKLGIEDFFEKEFDPTQPSALAEEADVFTNRKAMEIINRARATLQSFKLSDNMDFAQFLEIHSPIDNGIIAKAKQDILKQTKDAIENPANKRAARMASIRILQNASRDTTKKLTDALRNLYHQQGA
jgi:hypothetical protein